MKNIIQGKVVYLVNPKAGKLSIKQKEKVISQINPNNQEDIIFTKTSQESSTLARHYMKRKALVIACGGDGMINLIAQQAIETSSVIGILPFGRGNDFARSLGIKSIRQAIDNLKQKKVTECRYLDLKFSNNSKISSMHIPKDTKSLEQHRKEVFGFQKRGNIKDLKLSLKKFERLPIAHIE